MTIQGVFGVAVALMAAGCAVSSVSEDVEESDSVITGRPITPDGIATVPAYFDYDNHYAAAEQGAPVYAYFNANLGKSILVDLHRRPEAQNAVKSFTIYEVMSDAELRIVSRVEGASGAAVQRFKSGGTGSYVVKIISAGSISELELRLSCGGGDCSPDVQPGAYCGGVATVHCPAGLYCSFASGAQCGASDHAGACAVRPNVCTLESAPVCGCDGQTYGNACEAAAAGVSVEREGKCVPPILGLAEVPPLQPRRGTGVP